MDYARSLAELKAEHFVASATGVPFGAFWFDAFLSLYQASVPKRGDTPGLYGRCVHAIVWLRRRFEPSWEWDGLAPMHWADADEQNASSENFWREVAEYRNMV